MALHFCYPGASDNINGHFLATSSSLVHYMRPEDLLVLPGEPGQFHLWPGIGQGS